jgi:hypothetical protein
MLGEVGEPGAWTRVFDQPNLTKFDEPTVEGIEFPTLGVAQAWNDNTAGALWVETYAATSAARGQRTTWRVTQLPAAGDVSVVCDGSDFTAWRAIGQSTIEIDTDVDHHVFRIDTGFHGAAGRATPTEVATEKRPGASIKTLYTPASSCSASCCG